MNVDWSSGLLIVSFIVAVVVTVRYRSRNEDQRKALRTTWLVKTISLIAAVILLNIILDRTGVPPDWKLAVNTSIVAVAAGAVAMREKRWWVRLIAFVPFLGAINILASMLEMNPDWRLLMNAVALIAVGAVSFSKKTPDWIMGAIFVVFGAFIGWSALQAFGVSTEAIAASPVTNALLRGLSELDALINRVLGSG